MKADAYKDKRSSVIVKIYWRFYGAMVVESSDCVCYWKRQQGMIVSFAIDWSVFIALHTEIRRFIL